MLENFIRNATHIYFACGATDFRKQTESLASLVSAQFKLDPYLQDCVFVFCNKKEMQLKFCDMITMDLFLPAKSFWME